MSILSISVDEGRIGGMRFPADFLKPEDLLHDNIFHFNALFQALKNIINANKG